VIELKEWQEDELADILQMLKDNGIDDAKVEDDDNA
jgi:hypothetical protein